MKPRAFVLQKYSVLYLLCGRKITWPGPQSFLARAREEAGGAEGSAPPKPPVPPGCPRWAPSHPASLALHPLRRGMPRPGAEEAPTSLGGPRRRRGPGGDPAAVVQSASTGWGGAPADPPSALHQSPVCPRSPWDWSHGIEQEGDTYILSDDSESEPEAGHPAPTPSSPSAGSGAAPGPVLAEAESRSWAS